jgi:hypothetical protein
MGQGSQEEVTAFEFERAQLPAGIADGKHFGVRRGIVRRRHLI